MESSSIKMTEIEMFGSVPSKEYLGPVKRHSSLADYLHQLALCSIIVFGIVVWLISSLVK